MPIRLIDPSKPKDWVLPKDLDDNGKPKPDATIIGLVALSEGDVKALTLSSSSSVSGLNDASRHDVLMKCIRYLKRVPMIDGSVRDIVDPKEISQVVDQMAAVDSSQIALACMSESLLDAGTIKNSEESPASPHS